MANLRLLIVDDEPIIAMEIASIVEDAGYEATAVVSSIDAALAVIDSKVCDAAVLDANLRGCSAAPIALRLRDAGLPFIVVTGYTAGQLGDWVGDASVLAKPFDVKILTAELSKLKRTLVQSCANAL
jgi:DNA-binding response OmpR family regulator